MTRHVMYSLLWKNGLLLRKKPGKIIFAILFPVFVIGFLGYIKQYSTTTHVPAGWSKVETFGIESTGISENLFETNYITQESTVSPLLLKLAIDGWKNRIHSSNMSSTANITCIQAAFGGNVSLNPSSAYAWPVECIPFVIPRKIAIVPDNSFTREHFVGVISQWYPRVSLNDDKSFVIPKFEDSVVFFDNSTSLDQYVSSSVYGKSFEYPQLLAAIVFKDTLSLLGNPGALDYSIRMSLNANPSTLSDPMDLLQCELKTSDYQRYATSGFMAIQTLVTRFATCTPNFTYPHDCTLSPKPHKSNETNKILLEQFYNDPSFETAWNDFIDSFQTPFNPSEIPQLSLELLVQPLYQLPQAIGGAAIYPFPIDSYIESSFFSTVQTLLGFLFLFAYMQFLSCVLTCFVGEKESKNRELQKIVGISESWIIFTWLILFCMMALFSAFMTSILATQILFINSNFFLLLFFFFFIGLSVVSFGFTISAIFSKARLATQVGTFLYFLIYSLISSLINPQSSTSSKYFACLFPPGATNLGISLLASSEASGVGITMDNYRLSIDNFDFASILLMLAMNCVMYITLGWYLEKVIPKEYGVAEPWYFPFQFQRWRRYFSSEITYEYAEQEHLLNATEFDNNNMERVSQDLNRQVENGEALQIFNLRKVFNTSGTEKIAVEGMNLTMYKNQITCLLGHNGAGKTTLISMLTGMIPATSGDATINKLSLKKDLNSIRLFIGMCPQHNILYPELTVEEHLRFYGQIKGFFGTALEEEITRKMDQVGLVDKRYARTTELSGGMKRKLSLAIAFLGNSKLIFLDEPTSGMDPYSRRSTWDVIANNRHNRIIVLTTHFMDEADILGDRIAIMAEGELRCCGSSLFLKNRYGAGYSLSFVKGESCDVDALVKFITKFVSRAKILSNVGTEISFQLPLDTSHEFPALFGALDDNMSLLDLVSYGISVTTLEEVFIKVAELGDVHHQHTLTPLSPLQPTKFDKKANLSVKTENLFGLQFMALLKKRFRIARRDKRLVLFGILAPVFLIYSGLQSLKTTSIVPNAPSISLTTASYPLGDRTPFGTMCESDWLCNSVDRFNHATAFNITAPIPVYPTTSPTVFNVTYDQLDTSGVDGFFIRLGEELWRQNYSSISFGGAVLMGSRSNGLFGYNLAVNTRSIHAAIVHKAIIDDAIYRTLGGSSITLTDAPFPTTSREKEVASFASSFAAAIFIVVAFAQYSAAIVPSLVHEKHPNHNSKHQQLVSGVSLSSFWLANYFCDFILYLIPCLSALGLIWFCDITELTGYECTACSPHAFSAVVVLFVLFGCAMIPFCYLLSYFFTEPSSSQTVSVLINMILGFGLIVTSFILDALASTKDLNATLKFIWRLSPLFNLGNALFKLSMQAILNQIPLFALFGGEPSDAFSFDVIGYELLYLAIESIVFFTLTIGIDFAQTFPQFKAAFTWSGSKSTATIQSGKIDSDVEIEAARVQSGRADKDAVILRQLRKVYTNGVVAVDSISLGLPQGECFGYLGINGAGKTTTMKMLTGDIVPTSGSGTLSGFDILSQQLQVRQKIGYCPQFDALLDLLTVREHLELFASIKGVSRDSLDEVVIEKMNQLNLTDFEHKLAKSLSGGTKRKLSVAIAMIGAPPIIFLDEPSTGMDPVSRRFMWRVISDISTKSKESTIVLTTHSMEECEALCTRVGIMVDGGLRCLGSIQHLKHKFGNGFMLYMKLAPPSIATIEQLMANECFDMAVVTSKSLEQICTKLGRPERAKDIDINHSTGYVLVEMLVNGIPILDFCTWWLGEENYEILSKKLNEIFSNIKLIERQNDMIRYQLIGNDIKLSNIFLQIETLKLKLNIQDYTVSQTTLEQIFNSFASKQKNK